MLVGLRRRYGPPTLACQSRPGVAGWRGRHAWVTGELRSQIDKIWNECCPGGIANPIEVTEQLTYLLFVKRLDDLHTLEEHLVHSTGDPMRRTIFPAGKDEKGRPFEEAWRAATSAAVVPSVRAVSTAALAEVFTAPSSA